MTEDVLTFNELRQVQSRERDADTLQELREDFFHRAQNYLELKQSPDSHLENQEYRNAQHILQDIIDMRQKKIVKLAFLTAKSGVQVDNLLAREEDLFNQITDVIAAYRDRVETEIFTNGSADLSAPVSDTDTSETEDETRPEPDEDPDTDTIFTGSDEDAAAEPDGQDEEDQNGGETEPDTADEKESVDGGLTRVVVQEDVPEFMGVDLEAYGPFEEGEEAMVPEKNATVLVDQGKADRAD